MMNKAEANLIMHEVQAAMEEVLEKHGLRMKAIRSTYSAVDLQVRMTLISSDPAEAPEVRDWERYHDSYGLPMDALGKTVAIPGSAQAFIIRGLDIGRRKYPVVVERIDNRKRYVLPAWRVKQGLGIEVQPWERI